MARANWVVKAGGVGRQISQTYGTGITLDGSSGSLVTGSFCGAVTFGSTSLTNRGACDAFVMRVSGMGVIDWAVQAGGTGPDQAAGIASDTVGGAFVTGSFSGGALFGSTVLQSSNKRFSGTDVFVMHVTASGEIDWAVQAGGTNDAKGSAIVYDGAGGAFVTGDFMGNVTFGSTWLQSRGSSDSFVMHVTASGVIDWAIQAGGGMYDAGNGIAYDGEGGALVAGRFMGDASFGPVPLISRGSSDAFVMHVTASGDVDWAIHVGGTSSDEAVGITHDGAGGALVTGSFRDTARFGDKILTSQGGSDVFVIHVKATQHIQWVAQAGDEFEDGGVGIVYGGAGGALVTGFTNYDVDLGVSEVFVANVTGLASAQAKTTDGCVPPNTHPGCHDGVPSIVRDGSFEMINSAGAASGSHGSTAGGISYRPLNQSALVTGTFYGNLSFGSKTVTGNRVDAAHAFVASILPFEGPTTPPPSQPSPSAPAFHAASFDMHLKPAVVGYISSIFGCIALLSLLLACLCCRHYRRKFENLRISRDRAQIDLHMLEHRVHQETYPGPTAPFRDMESVSGSGSALMYLQANCAGIDVTARTVRPTVRPGMPPQSPFPNSIPPGPPSSRGGGPGSVGGSSEAPCFRAPTREDMALAEPAGLGPLPPMGPIDDSGAEKVWRGIWTAEEDESIIHGVLKHGTAWDVVAQEVGTRSADSVRNRWQRIKNRPLKSGHGSLHGSKVKVDPTMANGITAQDLYVAAQPGWSRFTQHEDGIIMDAVARMGKQWRKIAELLPGRTENSVRNRHTRIEEEMGRQPSYGGPSSEPSEKPLVFVTPLLPPVPHVAHTMPMAHALPLSGDRTASYASAAMPPLVAVPPSAALPPFWLRPAAHLHHTTLLALAPAVASATVPAAIHAATRKRGAEEVTGIDLTSAPRIAVHASIVPQPVGRDFVSGCSAAAARPEVGGSISPSVATPSTFIPVPTRVPTPVPTIDGVCAWAPQQPSKMTLPSADGTHHSSSSSTGEGVSYTDISTSESGRASILAEFSSEPEENSVELDALVESFFAN